jgi:hypothetical protein
MLKLADKRRRRAHAKSQRGEGGKARIERANTVIPVDDPEALAQRGPAAVYIRPDGKCTLFDSTMVAQLTDATGKYQK